MSIIKRPSKLLPDRESIEARRKSFIAVMAHVLARELQLVPPVAKKSKRHKGI